MTAAVTPARYSLVLEVREPALFPDRPGGGNSSSTLEFIPGSSLRGSLAQRYLRRGAEPDAAFDELFERAVRFLDGRLQIDGQRSAPVPLSARRCKSCGNESRKDLVEQSTVGNQCPTCDGDFKGFRGWWHRGSTPERDRFGVVETSFSGRTSMENGVAKNGSLRFASYLAGGNQRFEAHLVGPEGAVTGLLDSIGLDAGTVLRMGAGASAGGSFEVVKTPSPVSGPSTADLGTGPVAVDFLSRAVLVDPFLRAVTVPDPPSGWAMAGPRAQPWAYTSTDEVHGWNAGQQLPKPVDRVVAAGSVVVVEPSRQGDAQDQAVARERVSSLQAWADHGLGLRRAEGFGEVAFRPVTAPLHGIVGDEPER